MVLQSCVLFWSLMNGVQPQLSSAVISTESSWNVMALGKTHKEIGLFQIRPEFSKLTKLQLFQPCTNVMTGTTILRQMREKYKFGVDKTYVNCYNLGLSGCKKLKYPLKFRYYRKIAAKMGK